MPGSGGELEGWRLDQDGAGKQDLPRPLAVDPGGSVEMARTLALAGGESELWATSGCHLCGVPQGSKDRELGWGSLLSR